jgi:hypothetical protein
MNCNGFYLNVKGALAIPPVVGILNNQMIERGHHRPPVGGIGQESTESSLDRLMVRDALRQTLSNSCPVWLESNAKQQGRVYFVGCRDSITWVARKVTVGTPEQPQAPLLEFKLNCGWTAKGQGLSLAWRLWQGDTPEEQRPSFQTTSLQTGIKRVVVDYFGPGIIDDGEMIWQDHWKNRQSLPLLTRVRTFPLRGDKQTLWPQLVVTHQTG